MVLFTLEKYLTPEIALKWLPHFPELLRRHSTIDPPGRPPEFLRRAFELLLEDDVLLHGGRTCLADVILSLPKNNPARIEWGLRLLHAFQDDAEVRRHYYASDVSQWRQDPGSRPQWDRRGLNPADWKWLRGQADREWKDYPPIWEHLYFLGYRAFISGNLNAEDWVERIADLEAMSPGLDARMKKLIRKWDEEEQELVRFERELNARVPPKISLQEEVESLLAVSGVDVTDRLHRIVSFCFAQEWSGVRVEGTWESLPAALQVRALTAVREWLDYATPAPPPVGQKFSLAQLTEGLAFVKVLEDPATPPEWTTGPRIASWLPSALLFPQNEEYVRMLRRCHQANPGATETVLRECVRNEVATSEYATRLQWVPDECWTDTFVGFVLTLVKDDTFPAAGRAAAFRVAARHALSSAELVARVWAQRMYESISDRSDVLRAVGRSVLLTIDPKAALQLIEIDHKVLGSAALEELGGLWGLLNEAGACPHHWSLVLRGQLLRLLLRSYPSASDPEDRWGFMTPSKDLIALRDELLNQLLGDHSSAADEVLDNLLQLDESLKSRLDRRRSARAATMLVGVSGPPVAPPVSPIAESGSAYPADSSRLTLRIVMALLSRADFRLLRNQDDLLDVLLEVLGVISKDATEDLSLLYFPPKKGCARERLNEDALQAYIRRRLRDLLPSRINTLPFEALREDQVKFGERLDIRVIAPVSGPLKQAQVVIELKWSDNKGTKASLITQLGRRYLLRESLTHGIYLVGWNGTWAAKRGAEPSLHHLSQFLKTQAGEFTGESGEGKGCRIEPIVLDLSFPPRSIQRSHSRPRDETDQEKRQRRPKTGRR